jgi:hypothetical protein
MGGEVERIETFRPDWLSLRLAFITRRQFTRPPVIQTFIDEVRRIELRYNDPENTVEPEARLPDQRNSIT